MNAKAQITDIKLDDISVNLSDSLSDIRGYDGFLKCNSPHIGGMLNNTYRKNVEVPEGHELICVHNGDVWTFKKNHIYKNNVALNATFMNELKKTEYTSNKIGPVEDNGNYFKIGNTIIYKEGLMTCTYKYTSGSGSMISIAPMNTEGPLTDDNVRCFTGSGTEITSNKFVIVNGYTQYLSDIEKPTAASTCVHTHFDACCLIVEYAHDNDLLNDMWISRQGKSKTIQNVFRGAASNYWPFGVSNLNFLSRNPTNYEYYWFSPIIFNKQIVGISRGYSDIALTYDVKNIIQEGFGANGLRYIIYDDNNGKRWKLEQAEDGSVYENHLNISFDERYIYTNSVSVNGKVDTIDMETGECFKRASGFFASGVLYDKITPTTTNYQNKLVAIGRNASFENTGKKYFSTVLPPASLVIPEGTVNSNIAIDSIAYGDIQQATPSDVYIGEVAGGTPKYAFTIAMSESKGYIRYIDEQLEDVLYPISSDGNTLYNTPLDMDIKSTYANTKIGVGSDYTYVLATAQDKTPLLGYYDLTMSQIKDVFLLQTGFFGIKDRYIYSLDFTDNVMSILSTAGCKEDLVMLGAFPQFALFWSQLDKSLYAFSGSNTISKMKEAYRINEIRGAFCDPARNTMLVATDIGTVVVYQSQVFLLENLIMPDGVHIYYDNGVYILDDVMLSFSAKEGFTQYPIHIQTEYYGVGSMMKSVNDCVYVRICDNGNDNGYIRIKSHTLTDHTEESMMQEWPLTRTLFDAVTGTRLIEYQPQHQSGMGFSVDIESTAPIISLAIGHTPEAIQQVSKAGASVITSSTAIDFD